MSYVFIILFYISFCTGIFFIAKKIMDKKLLGHLKKDFHIRPGLYRVKTSAGYFNNIATKIGSIFQIFVRSQYREKYQVLLDSIGTAGRKTPDFNTLLGYKILYGFIAGIAAASLLKVSYLIIPGFLCSFATGFFLPDFFLRRTLKNKLEEFEYDLPYAMDLLYIATLSGQNIFNSIKILTEKYRGSVTAELSRFLKEINFGIGRNEAYRNALGRNKADSFRNLLFLLVQAEKYGSRISEVLKQRSGYLRFELMQKHDIRSRRMSIVLLFPLVFLILPAFVLLVGGPLVFSIAGSFIFS